MIPTDEDDVETWKAFELRALESLRDAGFGWRGTGTFSQVFRFIIAPSFSTATAYTLSDRGEPVDGTRFCCVRTKWDRQYDRERFLSSLRTKKDLKPTLDKALIGLSDDFAKSILAQLQDISVPLFVQRYMQIDGTYHEFSNLQATLNWGENAPAEWKYLAETALNYMQSIDGLA
jgi:hypothetical protein